METHFCEPIGHVQVKGDYVESWQPHPMSERALARGVNTSFVFECVREFRASDNPGVFRMNLTAKRLSAEITGAGQPRGPISVLFSDGGGVDRPGVLADCDSAGKHALRCKH